MREEYIKQCIAYLLVHIASLLICYIVNGNSVFLKLQHFQFSRHHYYLCSNNVVIIILITFELTWKQHLVTQVMKSAFFSSWLLQTQYHQPAILGFTVALSWFLLYSNDCDYYFLDHAFCDEIWNTYGKH